MERIIARSVRCAGYKTLPQARHYPVKKGVMLPPGTFDGKVAFSKFRFRIRNGCIALFKLTNHKFEYNIKHSRFFSSYSFVIG